MVGALPTGIPWDPRVAQAGPWVACVWTLYGWLYRFVVEADGQLLEEIVSPPEGSIW